MDALIHDLRYALRGLRRTPGFATAAVLTLALGIGANTAVFSVFDGVLLRPAPFRDVDRLAMVWQTDRNSGTTREPASVPDYTDFRARSRSFRALAAFRGLELTLTPAEGDPVRLAALATTHEFLPTVGIEPLVGRLYGEEEDRPDAPPVALIGEGLWERAFARDPDIVGRAIDLDGVAYTVLGVLPEAADFGTLQILSAADYQRSFADRGEAAEVEVWTPLRPDPARSSRDTHPIFVLGRLADGVTRAAAQEEMAAISADLEEAYASSNAGRGALVEPLPDVVFGPVRPALLLLLAAVGLVLLTACANVANLLLARGAARAREVALRTALGAGTARLGRQLLAEGVVLALAGAAAGVLVAAFGTELLLALAPPDIPRLGSVGVDGRVLGVALAVSLAVGVGFGLLPTLQARRLDVARALKGGSTGTVGPARASRSRSALIVGQLALAVVLAAGAGLLIRSVRNLHGVDAGFQAAGVLKAELQLPRTRYPADFSRWPDFVEMHRFNEALLRGAAALPGVEAVGIAGNHPLDQGFTNSFAVAGREDEAATWPEISVRRVTPGYFRTVGLPLRRGRLLAEADGTAAPPVALVNEAAAARFFPGGDPLGERILLWGAERTVVGIVGNEKFQGLRGADPIALYLPLAQAPSVNGAEALLVRTAGDPAALAPAVRGAIREIDPALAVFAVEPLRETVGRAVGRERFTALLLGAFAALALALAAIGVHGVLSYAVARRAPELGIRAALGATRRDLLRLVLGQGARLAALGLVLGLAGSLAASGLLRSLLFGVVPTDPPTLAGVITVVVGSALLASWIPARRAARMDPARVLRAE